MLITTYIMTLTSVYFVEFDLFSNTIAAHNGAKRTITLLKVGQEN